MKTIVLNFFKHTAMASNVAEAVAFINSLPGITANPSTIQNLENYFAGTSRYPLNEIATTGCGANRIFVYVAEANTLEAHNAKVAERKQAKIDADNARLNAFNPGQYLVDLKIIRLEGAPRYKSISVEADSQINASSKALDAFWSENPQNAVRAIVQQAVFII